MPKKVAALPEQNTWKLGDSSHTKFMNGQHLNKNSRTYSDIATFKRISTTGVGEAEEQQKITEKRELGDIPTNQLKKENFDVVVYGEESTTRDLVAKLGSIKQPRSSQQYPGKNSKLKRTLLVSSRENTSYLTKKQQH
jgi:hypothetical protein